MRWGAALALGLVLLTHRQTAVWRDEYTLWTHAQRLAPQSPRPVINLAVQEIAWGHLDAAAWFLHQAGPLVAQQDPFERAWSTDLLEVNWAVIDIQQGRIEAAHQRLQGQWPDGSARWRLCRAMPTVCAP